ncbi:MAG: ABC transporter ATP-binding protein/permease [Roseburia sp.]|nr:ABC transporter ATP-binding protein/permease [Roseburia sp.]MCM1279594.1 ABC transporter ATP-binding protein/permease [Robinsoniella sp.]
MIKVLKFAKKSWYVMIIILLLLFVQANCDLALPEYTSDIVDVGIQSKGIESPVPERMREETFERLVLFMNQEEEELFRSAYRKNGTIYELMAACEEDHKGVKEDGITYMPKEEYEKFRQMLIEKETVLSMLTSGGEEADAMKSQMLSQMGLPEDTDMMTAFSMLPKETVLAICDGISEKLEDMSDLIGESTAIAFVSTEYEAMGMDVDKMQMDYLKRKGLEMLGIAVLGMVVSIVVAFIASRLAANVAKDLRNKVYKKVVSFSNGEMNQFSTSSLITRCTNDIQQVQMVLIMIFRIVVYAPIMGIGGIIKVIQTGTHMTWIIAVAVVSVLSLVGILMIVAMPKFKMMQTLVDRLNLVSRETLTGISVIRAFGREKYEEDRFQDASTDLMKTQLFTHRTMAFMMPTMMFIMNGITVLIIWVGAHGIDLGNLQVGDMMAFITYTMQIVMSFLMITMVSVMLPRAAVSAVRIDEVLNTENHINNPKKPEKLEKAVKGVVSFEHVSFAYPGSKEDALEDIDFTANPGETTAIIGSTGCGKSTLVQLLPRLYDVSEGAVKIDGVDIRQLDLADLRDMIGYVPQKGMLFSGTIKSNIGFGRKEVPMEQIKEAAEIAQASEFILAKPDTFEEHIAQGGGNVSGGQKQRLSIARAIAKQPKIYVFDDSFSALDYKTDQVLRKALNEKTKDATVIIVAQRISTILHADKILVLDDGKIVGEGTHKELLAENEVYRQIAASQLSEAEMNASAGKDGGKQSNQKHPIKKEVR